LGDLVGYEANIKMDIKELEWEVVAGVVAVSFEHCNEHSDAIKGAEFVD
jgi:hypothetical protein